jgi:Bacterial Ig-like domain
MTSMRRLATPATGALLALIGACVGGCDSRHDAPPHLNAVALVAPTGPGPTLASVSSDHEGSGGVCRMHDLSVTFSEPMDPASIDGRSFSVTDEGQPVPGTVSLDKAAQTARFVPADPAGFAPSRTIVAAVRAGSSGVRSRAGVALAADRAWAFTTGWQPCHAEREAQRATTRLVAR